MWSARLDLRLPCDVATLLGRQTDISQETISAVAMSGRVPPALLLPLREHLKRNRSSWIQYCPLCLADDGAPYFLSAVATGIACFLLRTRLRILGPMSRLP
jgi:hypothetical protein